MLKNSLWKKNHRKRKLGKDIKEQMSARMINLSFHEKTHDLVSELLQKKQTMQQARFSADVIEEVTHVRHIHETIQDSCSSMEGVIFLKCPLNNEPIISFGSRVRRTDNEGLCERPQLHNKRSWRLKNLRENLKPRLFCN